RASPGTAWSAPRGSTPPSPSASTRPFARPRTTPRCATSSQASGQPRAPSRSSSSALPSRPTGCGGRGSSNLPAPRPTERSKAHRMTGTGAERGELRRAPSADLCSGLLFAGLGAAILWVGADYALGVPSRIGPGYVPRLLGIVLAVIGLFL